MVAIELVEDEHGLFVYRCDTSGVRVYKGANRGQVAGPTLRVGSVVSGTTISNGFLRLENGSGWARLSELSPVDVEHTCRLYATCCYGSSICPRYHPDHSERNTGADNVAGLVSVHARVKGIDGVWFVRVEGRSCWLPQTSASDGAPLLALAEEEDVLVSLRGAHPPPPIAALHHGLFVHRVENKPIRVWRDASCSASQCSTLPVGTVISCHIRKVVGDGSVFARLEDGSGWIRERDGSDGGRLRAAGLEYVRAQRRVTNNGASLILRTRPDHASAYRSAREVDGMVTSYARVVGTTGDIYVRVEGQGGWLFESREGQQTLQRFSAPRQAHRASAVGHRTR